MRFVPQQPSSRFLRFLNFFEREEFPASFHPSVLAEEEVLIAVGLGLFFFGALLELL